MAVVKQSLIAEYRWEYAKLIPRAVIRDYAREVAEIFDPEKIILFGSYAYGDPHKDGDVDILVVMPAYDEMNQAVRILEKTTSSFPLDLIVRTPHNLRWRLEEGDWFLREVITRGTVLYEKAHRSVDSQGRKRFPRQQDAGTDASTRAR
jgi:predicted nucleotidyltransferase